MKRIACLVITVLIFLSSFSPGCHAGGREGIDMLTNGTTIRYVPQNKIPNVIQEYQALAQQNLNRNFTLQQDLAIKCGAILSGVFFCLTGNLIRNDGKVFHQEGTETSCTRNVVSGLLTGCGLLGSAIAFFYPNWLAYDVDKKNGTFDSFIGWLLVDIGKKRFGYSQVLEDFQWYQKPPREHDCYSRDMSDNDGIALVTTRDGRTAVGYQSEIDQLRQIQNFPYGCAEYPDGWTSLNSDRFGTNDSYG